jgi:hypothetical protein
MLACVHTHTHTWSIVNGGDCLDGTEAANEPTVQPPDDT